MKSETVSDRENVLTNRTGDSSPETWSGAAIRGLLSRRGTAAVLLGGVMAYLGIGMVTGHLFYRCPFRFLTGLSCPGCGLSRALRLMVTGEFAAMWRLHPFAPYVAMLGVMLAGAALLPSPWRERWTSGWTALETRARVHAVALIGFAVFGTARCLQGIMSR